MPIHRNEEDAIVTAIEMYRSSYGNGDSRAMAKAIVTAVDVFQAQVKADEAAAAAAAVVVVTPVVEETPVVVVAPVVDEVQHVEATEAPVVEEAPPATPVVENSTPAA